MKSAAIRPEPPPASFENCRAPAPARLQLDRLRTPIGTVLLVTDAKGALRALDFEDGEARMRALLRTHYGRQPLPNGPAPGEVRNPLREYFEGKLQALRAIAWSTAGTPFQQTVWHALVRIRAGETRSYAELARSLGFPDAARAVGWANGSNPVALVVPCHRVVGASGKLLGFAGGLHRKRWLLTHEGARVAAGASGDLFDPWAWRRRGPDESPYLRTHANGTWNDNLLARRVRCHVQVGGVGDVDGAGRAGGRPFLPRGRVVT